ncbi:MAG TPA: aminopeptidase N [Acidisphaera sp.]|nr:aminopeptidase N [Acidisphaera sp.]
MADVTTNEVFLRDYTPPAFLIDTVDLHFTLEEARTIVRSTIRLRRNRPGDLVLDGEALTLLSIAVDGRELAADRYSITDKQMVLRGVADAFTLTTEVAIAPKDNTLLSGLYVSGGNFFTQCEAEGFRRITYFLDRPDVMARYTTTIVAPRAACPVLLSNGNPDGAGENADGTHWARWVDPHPKPSYLFALVAGDLVAVRDSFRTRSGRDVALAIWVRRGDEDRCAHAMYSLKTAMKWDEDTFGLEYDLDVFNIAAVSDFNMGAMENKGLNVFNTVYVLARHDTATDADYQGVETVTAHEYFHNWTGNRVTCRDWFQLSLKEGLTVFRDQEFTADQGSAAVKRIHDVIRLRAAQFREDAGPLAHPVRPDRYRKIDNFYTATVYQKGAEVIRMIRTLIGRAAFRRGMDIYIARNDNSAATIENFVAAMQEASGRDLSDFMHWYDQAGTPVITVSDDYDPGAKRYTLTLRQDTPPTPNQPVKHPLTIPVAMGLLGANGAPLPSRLEGEREPREGTRVLELTKPEQRFVFVDVPSAPVPSLLRAFSAPVKLQGLSRERLRFLAAHDDDPFVRWESGQQYAASVLLEAVANSTTANDPALVEIVAAALGLADHAFAAEAMMLPTESFLADQMEVVDPDGLHRVREAARMMIGRALRDRLLAARAALEDDAPYTPDGASIGRRSLRNSCLGYLASADAAEGARLAKAQFDAGRNMTDVLAALATLTRLDCPERQAALDAFYERWRGDPLVIDKWFSMQAYSMLPDTLAKVRALMAHPDFDLRNPNRVRSLIGAFAGNQVRFHAASGEGYALLADTILSLDPKNPQVAARMTSPLGQWRRFDAGRQAKMRAELERIAAAPGLSENTREMVTRSLG